MQHFYCLAASPKTFTTAPPIVNNNDAIYFLPKIVSNQPSPTMKIVMASFSSLCFSVSIHGVGRVELQRSLFFQVHPVEFLMITVYIPV